MKPEWDNSPNPSNTQDLDILCKSYIIIANKPKEETKYALILSTKKWAIHVKSEENYSQQEKYRQIFSDIITDGNEWIVHVVR